MAILVKIAVARPPKRAVIVGTSFLEGDLPRTSRIQVSTPYGNVDLMELENQIVLQRHGLDRYHPPHRIHHHAHLSALHQWGAERIIALGSVGSLHLHRPPGSVVIPDDFFAPTVTPSFHDDAHGHQLPRFDPSLRRELLELLTSPPLPTPVDGGVYWQTTGPRFETPAEIRFHAHYVDYVGMTIASECILASELALPYAMVGIVDNFAHGIGHEPLTMASFKNQVARNRELAFNILDKILNMP